MEERQQGGMLVVERKQVVGEGRSCPWVGGRGSNSSEVGGSRRIGCRCYKGGMGGSNSSGVGVRMSCRCYKEGVGAATAERLVAEEQEELASAWRARPGGGTSISSTSTGAGGSGEAGAGR